MMDFYAIFFSGIISLLFLAALEKWINFGI